MATGTIKFNGDLETGVIASEAYGTVTYGYNKVLHIAWIRWSGNNTTPSVTSRDYVVPDKLEAKMLILSPLRSGEFIQINGKSLSINFGNTPKNWSAGSICYPTI